MTSHVLFLLVLATLLPALISACRCLEAPSVQRSLKVTDYVVRGRIIRKLRDVDSLSTFEVLVKRVYKGCDVTRVQRIVVTTGSSSASCGIDLRVPSTYLLSGYTRPLTEGITAQLPPGSNITQVVSVLSCDYNALWATLTFANRDGCAAMGIRNVYPPVTLQLAPRVPIVATVHSTATREPVSPIPVLSVPKMVPSRV
jgi:Tissue inhibitor of metalloproteinase